MTRTFQAIVAPVQSQEWTIATETSQDLPAIACQIAVNGKDSAPSRSQVTKMPTYWLDKEDRQAYMEATVEQDIAWQIRVNRERRKLSQKQLAQLMNSKQSAISRMEDSSYGRYSIPALVKVAHVFDCALLVKLIPYSRLAVETQDTSVEALYVEPFSNESNLIEG